MCRGGLWCAVVAIACGIGAGRGWAQTGPTGDEVFAPLVTPTASDEPVAFAGDRFVWDRNSNVITGDGRIEIEQGRRRLESDRIRLFLDRQIAELEGHVAISQEQQTVFGESATYDFARQQGTFVRPRTYTEPWYVTADEFVRESPTTFRAEDAHITTCDREPPDWSIGIGDLEFDQETQRVRGTNIIGRAGRVPIFYTPAYSQRVDRDRPPIEYDVGWESDVGGFLRFGFPYDLSDDIELQPKIDLFTKSGVGAGLGAGGRLLDTTEFDTDLWYLNDLNDDNTEERGITADRHKFDWYGRTTLPDDWVALSQLEWWSDREVLKTFFWEDFKEREIPESFVQLTRTKPHTVIELGAEKRFDDFSRTRDDLPRVAGDLLEYRVFETPVYVSAHADAAYSELRPEDDHLSTSRQEVRFAAPWRATRWLNTVPFVEVESRWHDAGNLGTRESAYDAWARPGLALQSRWHAVFGSPLKRYSRMRHLFEPTLTYAWRDSNGPDPEDILIFDQKDVFEQQAVGFNENSIELELRNKIQGKRLDGTTDELIQYDATLDFDFSDGADNLARIENELLVRPANRWLFEAKSLTDLRDERSSSDVYSRLSYTNALGITGFTGLVYTDSFDTESRAEALYGLAVPFHDRWRVGFEHRVRTDAGELEQQEYWVWHRMHCWEFVFSVKDRNESTTVMLEIGLTAFPNRGLRKYRDEALVAAGREAEGEAATQHGVETEGAIGESPPHGVDGAGYPE